ncbi:MAG: hypothetical protein ABIQ02_07035 [Saprospiraceae bacterium]
MPFNPAIHHRRSIRLKGYDYSKKGLYYITVCMQNRKNLFGNITNGIMIPNDAGLMVLRWYFELENKFPDIKCGVHVVMPNHFHCIIENVGYDRYRTCESMGSPIINENDISPIDNAIRCTGEPRCSPIISENGISPIISENDISPIDNAIRCTGEPMCSPILSDNGISPILSDNGISPIDNMGENFGEMGENFGEMGEHIGSPLHRVMQWFATMTTNEYIRGVKTFGWERFDKKLWQRNYWEHVIRNESEHERISNYIVKNPKNWWIDKFRKT